MEREKETIFRLGKGHRNKSDTRAAFKHGSVPVEVLLERAQGRNDTRLGEGSGSRGEHVTAARAAPCSAAPFSASPPAAVVPPCGPFAGGGARAARR